MLFVGCFLEPTAAITILVPILLPIAAQLGVDPVHFGLVMVLNLMIGLLHPPMGMVLFVLARVANLSFERTTMAILPWLVPLLAEPGRHHLRADRWCSGCRRCSSEGGDGASRLSRTPPLASRRIEVLAQSLPAAEVVVLQLRRIRVPAASASRRGGSRT